MNTILWGGTLCSLFLYVLFMTPVKAPAPKVVVKQVASAVVGTAVAAEVAPKVDPQVALIERGRKLYVSNCISCHNRDPNIAGAIGPIMVDAPLVVMTSKVMTGKYPDALPAGFVPKRTTKQMRPLKKLEADIPAIHAWVQSVKKQK